MVEAEDVANDVVPPPSRKAEGPGVIPGLDLTRCGTSASSSAAPADQNISAERGAPPDAPRPRRSRRPGASPRAPGRLPEETAAAPPDRSARPELIKTLISSSLSCSGGIGGLLARRHNGARRAAAARGVDVGQHISPDRDAVVVDLEPRSNGRIWLSREDVGTNWFCCRWEP